MPSQYDQYMEQCISLARIASAAGDPPVGAIIVLEGQVIGQGIESGRSTGDITNHAEILAVKDAVKNGYAGKLHLASMYTTHEPCIMCAYVIRHHRIAEIIYGVSVPHIGGATSRFNILSAQDVPRWGEAPKIVSGICLEACNELTRG